ncbi:MAG: glucosamine-6-phosphate deaminase [Bacteroidetes bacterium]|nr:glucosamine-6-phosphate deaminase [Bacteroidota bacterium]
MSTVSSTAPPSSSRQWVPSGKSAFEKTPVSIFETAATGSLYVAHEIASLIRKRNEQGQPTVLGLATGSTPIQVYAELVRLHKEVDVSFEHVITFNLDEYYPMKPESVQSYVHFMNEMLFDHVNIKPENIHIPDGTLQLSELQEHCDHYEQLIVEAGGIDIQILGIGRTGHIGFNEPGSTKESTTRLIALDKITMLDAASAFNGYEHVPRRAITMGVSTILHARRIFLMAWGEGKAPIMKTIVEGDPTTQYPGTFVQHHSNCEVILDKSASAELTRIKTPWQTGIVEWTPYLIKRAVLWLSQTVNKPILKLTEEDYRQHGMNDILLEIETAYNINIQVFNEIQHTITGWPGGKPNADDTHRPERQTPYPKQSLVFSPHPDNDVISMGGTLLRLVEHGHEVHIAYQTSGNLGVNDDDVMRWLDTMSDFQDAFKVNTDTSNSMMKEVREFLASKKAGEPDIPVVREIKTLLRQGESRAACRYIGISLDQVHFLQMPFYETGEKRKKPISKEDVDRIKTTLNKVKPHQVFAAGDLSDPHGTHQLCLQAIKQAIQELHDEEWMKDCYFWLYRGAWQEWSIEDIDMAVPLSPDETDQKRRAIFKHQSQKDRPMFPGTDSREFWQRAEERNKRTAEIYNQIGLAEYEAIEGFVRWRDVLSTS